MGACKGKRKPRSAVRTNSPKLHIKKRKPRKKTLKSYHRPTPGHVRIPPKSRRHCRVCKKITMFEYDRTVGHSRCEGCGQTGTGKRIDRGGRLA